jgi:excisionase family DNA binding protein
MSALGVGEGATTRSSEEPAMTRTNRTLDDHADRPSGHEPMMSPYDVASYLGVPLRTVYRWRTRGDGPRGYRIGRHVRYRYEDVELWLEHHRDAS